MATGRARNADSDGGQCLRTRRVVLTEGAGQGTREQVAKRLAEFRRRTTGRGWAPSGELLHQTRFERMRALTDSGEGT